MIAASAPSRPARLYVIEDGAGRETPLAHFASLFASGDVLVVNDAATLPASLSGIHARSGAPIELRLAARRSLDPRDVAVWDAVLFGAGDHRTPTEARAQPPLVLPEDVLVFGALGARVEAVLGHPRMVRVRFLGAPREVWEGLATEGKPIQYAHVPQPLSLFEVWTQIAGPPVAVEAPSAGYVLDWSALEALRARGVEVVSLTHAAGLSSTGDVTLDARLPLPEPYAIPSSTALAIGRARARGARIIALGTTVTRALESAVDGRGQVRASKGLATLRLGSEVPLSAVDVLVSGVHEPGTSHFELMKAFADEDTLLRAHAAMEQAGFRHHEFGDAVWIARRDRAAAQRKSAQAQGRG